MGQPVTDRSPRHRVTTVALWVFTLGVAATWALFGAAKVTTHGQVLFGDVAVTSGTAGHTTLDVPPAGTLTADSHRGPVGVTLRLSEINLDRVGDTTSADSWRGDVEGDISGLVVDWFLTVATFAGAGGAMIGLAVSALRRQRRWARLRALRLATVTAVFATSVWGVAAGVAYVTFDPESFNEVTYTGALKYAPGVVDAITGEPAAAVADSASIVESQLRTLATSATGVSAADVDDSEVVLLHVSDMHLNPLGLQLTNQLAEQFQPDAVLDTGDFTSYGVSNLEGRFADLVRLDVPYLLAPGNHDSDAAVAELAASGDVIVLDDSIVSIRGLLIGGLADPSFTPAGSNLDRKDREALVDQRDEIRSFVEERQPDVLALHNPVQAAAVAGEPVTVAAGHLHRFVTESSGDTRLAVVGSTGAGGVGALSSNTQPYEAQLLRFRVGDDDRFELVAIDRISVGGKVIAGTATAPFSIRRVDPDTGPGEYLQGDADAEEHHETP